MNKKKQKYGKIPTCLMCYVNGHQQDTYDNANYKNSIINKTKDKNNFKNQFDKKESLRCLIEPEFKPKINIEKLLNLIQTIKYPTIILYNGTKIKTIKN